MTHDFSVEEAKNLEMIRAALVSVDESLTLPVLISLLTIALEPGLSVNDLADRIHVPQQSASRYSSILLGRYQNALSNDEKEPLIAQTVNETDPRKRALYLTSKGRALIASMLAVKSAKNSIRSA
jgi:DNA-binding MarR family transcriptional regulator